MFPKNILCWNKCNDKIIVYIFLMGDVRNDPIFETLVTYMQYLLLCGCVYMGTHSKDTYNYNEFTYASKYNIVIKKEHYASQYIIDKCILLNLSLKTLSW